MKKDKTFHKDTFKTLIQIRQRAYLSGDMVSYRKLRNQVNRESKSLRSRFYNNKVRNLKTSNNRKWWKDMKDLIGLQKGASDAQMQHLADSDCQGGMNSLVAKVNAFSNQ